MEMISILDYIAKHNNYSTWDDLLQKSKTIDVKFIIPPYFKLPFATEIFQEIKRTLDTKKVFVYDDGIVIKNEEIIDVESIGQDSNKSV